MAEMSGKESGKKWFEFERVVWRGQVVHFPTQQIKPLPSPDPEHNFFSKSILECEQFAIFLNTFL